ncbi:hypothetical protein [Paenibacillus sp. FSL H8-0168]|uniref:hypothetical protein n=1 Tax=Paenibacillus sp. FSL H8-0168 TaxID=2921378 RepID=UPI0031589A22
MAWFRVNVEIGRSKGELEMDQVGNESIKSIIEGFFSVFGAKKSPAPMKIEDKPVKVTVNPAPELSDLVLRTKAKEPEGISRKVNLLNSERTLSTSLGDKLAEAYKSFDPDTLQAISNATESNEVEQASVTPDWYKTGIKYKDGVPLYRCRYYCQNPECRNKGKHYIKEDETEVSCHNCGEQLEVRPAGTNYPLERDEWGNFFIADGRKGERV